MLVRRLVKLLENLSLLQDSGALILVNRLLKQKDVAHYRCNLLVIQVASGKEKGRSYTSRCAILQIPNESLILGDVVLCLRERHCLLLNGSSFSVERLTYWCEEAFQLRDRISAEGREQMSSSLGIFLAQIVSELLELQNRMSAVALWKLQLLLLVRRKRLGCALVDLQTQGGLIALDLLEIWETLERCLALVNFDHALNLHLSRVLGGTMIVFRVATNQPTTNPALEVGWLAR